MEIVPYRPEHREAVLALSMRAWAPVFPLLREAVPPFVYESFYPEGWGDRQFADLDEVLAEEPENIDVAVVGQVPAGWVCTRLHQEDAMSEVYVLAVDPIHQRTGVARALMERSFDRGRMAGMRMAMVETGDDPGHEPGRRAYEAVGFERYSRATSETSATEPHLR